MDRRGIGLPAMGIAMAALFMAIGPEAHAAKSGGIAPAASSKEAMAKSVDSQTASANQNANKASSSPSKGEKAAAAKGEKRSSTAADRPQLTLTLPEGAKPGDTIKAEVTADARLKNLAGAMIILGFPDGLFGPVPEDGGDVQSHVLKSPLVAAHETDGKIKLGLVARKGYDGPGLLASLPLVISPKTKPGRYAIRLAVELNDPLAKNLPAITRSATLVIGEGHGAREKLPEGGPRGRGTTR